MHLTEHRYYGQYDGGDILVKGHGGCRVEYNMHSEYLISFFLVNSVGKAKESHIDLTGMPCRSVLKDFHLIFIGYSVFLLGFLHAPERTKKSQGSSTVPEHQQPKN